MSADNPHVEALPDPPERCRYCPKVMPADWDVQGWHEVHRKHAARHMATLVATYYCCDPCYWAEVYDGPLEDHSGRSGPTEVQIAEMRRGGTR